MFQTQDISHKNGIRIEVKLKVGVTLSLQSYFDADLHINYLSFS